MKLDFNIVMGQVILLKRRFSGVSQKKMATAIGLTQSSYSRLECGKTCMTVFDLTVLARELDTSPSKILGEVDMIIAARLDTSVRCLSRGRAIAPIVKLYGEDYVRDILDALPDDPILAEQVGVHK